MYFDARIRRMVHYGLSDSEIAKSLEISVKEVREVVGLMSPPPIKVRNENGKVIEERLYLIDERDLESVS